MIYFSFIMYDYFQGGYRSGLTIAHGSSVSVQCEGGEDTVQMSMTNSHYSNKIIF